MDDSEIIDPKYPLPEELQYLNKEEAECEYCGIPYLIHSQVSKMKAEMQSMEQAVADHQFCGKREAELVESASQLFENLIYLQREIAEHRDDLASLEQVESDRRNLLDIAADNIDLLREEYNALRENIKTIMDDVKLKMLAETRLIVSDLLAEMDKIGRDNIATNLNLSKAREDIVDLESINVDLTKTSQEQLANFNALLQGASDRNKKVEEENARISSFSDSMRGEYEAEIARLRNELSERDEVLAKFQGSINHLDTLKDILKEKTETISKLQIEKDQMVEAHQSRVRDIQEHFKSREDQYRKIETPSMIEAAVTKSLAKCKEDELRKHALELEDLTRKFTKDMHALELKNSASESQSTEQWQKLTAMQQKLKDSATAIEKKDNEIKILKNIIKKECEERVMIIAQMDRLKSALPNVSK